MKITRNFIQDFGAVWRSPIGYVSKKTRFCGNYFLVTKDEEMFFLWALDMTDPDSGNYILLKKNDCSTQLVDEGQKLDDEIFYERVRKGEYFEFSEVFKKDDYTHIQDQDMFLEQVKRFEDSFKNEGREEGIDIGIEKERKIQQEKQYLEKLQIAKNFKDAGVAIEIIMKSTGLTKQEIENLM